MADRRKNEEEEAERYSRKLQRKRKKFKEALLEKAMRCRQEEEQVGGVVGVGEELEGSNKSAKSKVTAYYAFLCIILLFLSQKCILLYFLFTISLFTTLILFSNIKLPTYIRNIMMKWTGFLQSTKAFETQKITRNKDSAITDEVSNPEYWKPEKTRINVSTRTQDAKRIEDEKREQVAAVRRKFKEQHKKILESLMQKNKLEEMKIEEMRREAALKKEKQRMRSEKMLQRVEMKQVEEDYDRDQEDDQLTRDKNTNTEEIYKSSAAASERAIGKITSKAESLSTVTKDSKETPQSVQVKPKKVAVGSAMTAVRNRIKKVISERPSSSTHDEIENNDGDGGDKDNAANVDDDSYDDNNEDCVAATAGRTAAITKIANSKRSRKASNTFPVNRENGPTDAGMSTGPIEQDDLDNDREGV